VTTFARGAWLDIHIATCVGTLESDFDCLAAVAIGILRIPVPIKSAQFSQFNNLPNLIPPSSEALRAWQDWETLLAHHLTTPPHGWREWLNGMRNLHLHRARQSRVMLQHTRQAGVPALLFKSRDPERDAATAARFLLHGRRRPRLADMEDWVLSPTVSDLWLNEPDHYIGRRVRGSERVHRRGSSVLALLVALRRDLEFNRVSPTEEGVAPDARPRSFVWWRRPDGSALHAVTRPREPVAHPAADGCSGSTYRRQTARRRGRRPRFILGDGPFRPGRIGHSPHALISPGLLEHLSPR